MTTKRNVLRTIGSGSVAALSSGCVGRFSSSGEEETTTSTTTLSGDDTGGLAVHNTTESARTATVTITAVEPDKAMFDTSISLDPGGGEFTDGNYKTFSVFTMYGQYEIHVETDRDESKTTTERYRKDSWHYVSITLTSSGIEIATPTP